MILHIHQGGSRISKLFLDQRVRASSAHLLYLLHFGSTWAHAKLLLFWSVSQKANRLREAERN